MILLDDIEEKVKIVTKDGKEITFFTYDKMDEYREGEGNCVPAIMALRILARKYGGMALAELYKTGRLSESQGD